MFNFLLFLDINLDFNSFSDSIIIIVVYTYIVTILILRRMYTLVIVYACIHVCAIYEIGYRISTPSFVYAHTEKFYILFSDINLQTTRILQKKRNVKCKCSFCLFIMFSISFFSHYDVYSLNVTVCMYVLKLEND